MNNLVDSIIFPFAVIYKRLQLNKSISISIFIILFIGLFQFYVFPEVLQISVESSLWGDWFMFSTDISVGSVTAMFAHDSLQHLGYNLFSLLLLAILYNFTIVSNKSLLQVIVVTGFGALLGYIGFVMLVDPTYSYSIAGISGAVYGLYGLHTGYYILTLLKSIPKSVKTITTGSYEELRNLLANTHIFQYLLLPLNILYLSSEVYTQVSLGLALSDVAHIGHIIGFSIGFVYGLVYYYNTLN